MAQLQGLIAVIFCYHLLSSGAITFGNILLVAFIIGIMSSLDEILPSIARITKFCFWCLGVWLCYKKPLILFVLFFVVCLANKRKIERVGFIKTGILLWRKVLREIKKIKRDKAIQNDLLSGFIEIFVFLSFIAGFLQLFR